MKRWQFGLFCTMALALLAACERPDPNPVAAANPTIVPTVEVTPGPIQTPIPVQINVTVIMPPPVSGGQSLLGGQQVVVVVTPTPELSQAIIAGPDKPTPTPYPKNYYLGWAWSESLETKEYGRLFVGGVGAVLWDQPSPEGKRIGLVVGLSEVLVAGKSYCGYTPILTHLNNMLSMETPRPEVLNPAALEDRPVSRPPLFAVEEGSTSGWAYIGAVRIMEEIAVPGAFGINLRAEPCQYATRLGFVPENGPMTITGPQSGDYIPVRVANDVIQLPSGLVGPLPLEPDVEVSSENYTPTETP